MKKSTLQGVLLGMLFMQATQSMQAASFTQQENALAERLPHLHAALHKRGKSTSSLIEYLDHLVQTHHAIDTWHLKDDTRDYIKNLLQIIDTIAAEYRNQTISTILLQGNPGSLPVALLAATLFAIGRQDVSIQIISTDRIPSHRQLHRMVRTFLATNDRCFIQQFDSINAFANTSSRYLRKPDTIISFTGQPELLATVLSKPHIFDYAGRAVQ